ncbi:MAG: sel1 repeat family protein [Clostridia bacterium]|nr:sel1 repeat family protein [Clostridia bacterium]
MVRIVIKNGYIKGGGKEAAARRGNLVNYVATRDGVERPGDNDALLEATQGQQKLISQILRELPDSIELFEYEDYRDTPNRENASEFITIALEQNLSRLRDSKKYLDYIANRPRVERLGTHGLFTSGNAPLVLSSITKEISEHAGNVWTPIISLRREDAARLGFDSANAWKSLLSSKAIAIAENMKIHPDNLRWYAAFHNESHHPHCHMVCYSVNPKEGYLTKQGIEKMKSTLANEIFMQELIPLYAKKTELRDDLKDQAAEVAREVITRMQTGTLQNERIERLVSHLADSLQNVSGKKQYGYLKSELKNTVDEIVDELARDKRIEKAYRAWWELKSRIENTYTDKSNKMLPLSKCADFKPIRNMVIREALNISERVFTFEEQGYSDNNIPDDAPEQEQSADIGWRAFNRAKQYHYGDEYAGIEKDVAEAAALYRQSAESENEFAAYRLAKLYLGGEGILKDVNEAVRWFEFAAEKKHFYADYALGVLRLKGDDIQKDSAKAICHFNCAAELGNPLARYRLGKIYLTGEDAPKDIEAALHYLTASAEQGNQYAQYTLGKLYLTGEDVSYDKEASTKWFALSAAQGNIYAQFFLDNMDKRHSPSVMLTATRLLHHMSRIFADSAPIGNSGGLQIDRKRQQKLREKKQAAGHAKDDSMRSQSM